VLTIHTHVSPLINLRSQIQVYRHEKSLIYQMKISEFRA